MDPTVSELERLTEVLSMYCRITSIGLGNKKELQRIITGDFEKRHFCKHGWDI